MKFTLADAGGRFNTWQTYFGIGGSRNTSLPCKRDKNGIGLGGILLLTALS